MNPQSTAQTIADELEDQAHELKKLERRARALAQRSFASLRELEAFCQQHGIKVVRKERKP
jgi:hypothetical protein